MQELEVQEPQEHELKKQGTGAQKSEAQEAEIPS